VLLTSVTTHLIYNRRAFADEQSRLVAQTTILRDLVRRLREGERIPDAEYDRLIALAGRGGLAARQAHFYDAKRSETSWRDTILGQKAAPPSPHLHGESDENILREEWEAAVKSDASSSRRQNVPSSPPPPTSVDSPPSGSSPKSPAPATGTSTKVTPSQRQHPEYL